MSPKKTNSTAAELIASTIKSAVEQDMIKPGEKLPTLKDMERMYCVSRVVIREAVKKLEGEGILYSCQGSGIYVKEKTGHALFKNEDKRYSLKEICEVFEYLCYLACMSLKDREDLSELEELKKLNRHILDNFPKISSHEKFTYESSFGARIINMCDNDLALDLCASLMKPLTDMDKIIISDEEVYREILNIDFYLINALIDRNSIKACFWGHERNSLTLKAFAGEKDLCEKFPVY